MKAVAVRDSTFIPVRLTIELTTQEQVEQLYGLFNYTPFCEAAPDLDSGAVRDALFQFKADNTPTSHNKLCGRAEAAFKRMNR